LVLVRGGAPAAVDDKLEAVGGGIGRGPAQGAKEGWIEVGDTGNLVVEDGRAVGTAPPASPSASRCSLRERSTADAADEAGNAVKDDDTSDLEPTIAAMTTSSPATRTLRIRTRRVVRAGSP
jgi:hypothetical protein